MSDQQPTYTTLKEVNEKLGINLEPEAFKTIGLDSPVWDDGAGEWRWNGNGVYTTSVILLRDYFDEKLEALKSGGLPVGF